MDLDLINIRVTLVEEVAVHVLVADRLAATHSE
jgi:hypothetical protein